MGNRIYQHIPVVGFLVGWQAVNDVSDSVFLFLGLQDLVNFMGKSSSFILRDLGGAMQCLADWNTLGFFEWTTINWRKLEEMEI